MSAAIHRRPESAQPATVPELLRRLGVKNTCVSNQWTAITGWVADNQPSPRLWQSLLANGYALLLEEMIPEFRRPIPYQRITTSSGKI